MPDNPTFVVNDRRKFTSEGELRHDLPTSGENQSGGTQAGSSQSGPTLSGQTTESEPTRGPRLVPSDTAAPETARASSELADLPESGAIADLYPDQTSPVEPEQEEADGELTADFADDASLPPGPTAEQSGEAARAYAATVERLDFAMRAANPGGERMPEMTFERLVQSLYTQALLLLGGAAEPGETPRVDILGARQTVDMLSVVADKVKGNLSSPEEKLLDSALFDLHMGFLEVTQALARQAAQRQPGTGPGGMPPPGGPRIVR